MTPATSRTVFRLALFFLLAGHAAAQGVTGRIQGTVQDASRATVPGASVIALNQETGYRAEVSTGQSGDYVVPNMPPGKYTVTVAASGFKEAISKDVAVIVDGLTTLDFNLQVGSRSETVEVEGTGQLVDTQTSSMGNDCPPARSTPCRCSAAFTPNSFR